MTKLVRELNTVSVEQRYYENIDPKFEWKQCWSPWRIIGHHRARREPSAEGTRHLKILKDRVSETAFPAFLHDFGAKMQGRLRYETVFSVCIWLGIRTQMQVFQKCGFFTTVVGRWVSEFKCRSDPHEAGHLGSMWKWLNTVKNQLLEFHMSWRSSIFIYSLKITKMCGTEVTNF